MDFNEAKRQYKEIKAPSKLVKEVNNMFNKRKYYKVAVATAVVVIGTFVFTLNLSPVFAKTVSNIPGFSGIVKVLTGNRYEFNENGFNANVDTPKITGLMDEKLQAELNKEFNDYSDTIISQFNSEVESIKNEFGEFDGHMGVDMGYIVKTNNEKILALDIYVVNTVASSSTVHKFYNIDKVNNKVITLSTLLKDNSEYVDKINKYIKAEMVKANKEGATYWMGEDGIYGFEKIREDQSFYINGNGELVIVFDKYEVAPGYMGSPEFIIPKDIIEVNI